MNIDLISKSLFSVQRGQLGVEFGQLTGDNTFCNAELRKQDEKKRLLYRISFVDGETLPILFDQVSTFFNKCVPDNSDSWITVESSGLDKGNLAGCDGGSNEMEYSLSSVDFSQVDLSWVEQLNNMSFSEQYGTNQSFLARINDVDSCAICGESEFTASCDGDCSSEESAAFGLFGQSPVKFHGGCFKRLLGSLSVIASEQSHIVVANNI